MKITKMWKRMLDVGPFEEKAAMQIRCRVSSTYLASLRRTNHNYEYYISVEHVQKCFVEHSNIQKVLDYA